MTDAELIKSLVKKDENAFRYLIDNYQSMVFKACFYILNNTEDAEDTAQDVFIEAYLSVNNFRGDAKLSTWLYKIAINKSKNVIRKNRWQQLTFKFGNLFSGEKSIIGDLEDSSAQQSMVALEQSEDRRVLWKAIESLPENQRIAFTLNKYDELSYQEIANVLQTSVSAVESLIHRAKKNLQIKLYKLFS